MQQLIKREVTPLTPSDCFTLFSRVKSKFEFPLHYHEEFELNLILNAAGAQRIVGNHIGEISNIELAFIGSNVYHGWFTSKCTSPEITEVTIQFHHDLFNETFLGKNQLYFIRKMFENSTKGILFSESTINMVSDRILNLKNLTGFESVLELMNILHILSQCTKMQLLSNEGFYGAVQSFNSRRIESVFQFMNKNYHRPITLADVAIYANMHEGSFSRFIRKSTGKTFIDSLNEIRLGHASRLLIDTTQTISEIAYNCGFNNISNFNRIFKSKKNCTPKEFRTNFAGARIYI